MIDARRALGGILMLVVMTSASTVHAEAAEALANGRSLWRSFEYEDAIDQLQEVVGDESATVTQRLEALELLAVLHLTLRRQAQAQQTFVRLLNIDPNHELSDPGYPPRVQELFAQTRASFIPQTNIGVERSVPRVIPGDARTISMGVTVSGDTAGVERALVFIRAEGEASYRSAMMRRDGLTFTADVPVPPGGAALQYYIEVQAPSGYVLGQLGSQEAPQIIPGAASFATSAEAQPDAGPAENEPDAAPEPVVSHRPITRQWWFWTIIGVVVAGGAATGLAIGLQPDDPSGTLGGLTLP